MGLWNICCRPFFFFFMWRMPESKHTNNKSKNKKYLLHVPVDLHSDTSVLTSGQRHDRKLSVTEMVAELHTSSSQCRSLGNGDREGSCMPRLQKLLCIQIYIYIHTYEHAHTYFCHDFLIYSHPDMPLLSFTWGPRGHVACPKAHRCLWQ